MLCLESDCAGVKWTVAALKVVRRGGGTGLFQDRGGRQVGGLRTGENGNVATAGQFCPLPIKTFRLPGNWSATVFSGCLPSL